MRNFFLIETFINYEIKTVSVDYMYKDLNSMVHLNIFNFYWEFYQYDHQNFIDLNFTLAIQIPSI